MAASIPSSLLEHAAVESGFDLAEGVADGWTSHASTHAPLRVWLRADEDGGATVALSMADVSERLAEDKLGASASCDLPRGAAAARRVADRLALHRLLRRACQRSNAPIASAPWGPASEFLALPRTTEAERLVVQRVGQQFFRERLMDHWGGRCAVTGVAVPELLRASHIKPWAACESDEERLDLFNGLLLAANLDAVFDQGFVTFDDEGRVVFSSALLEDAARALAISPAMRLRAIENRHRAYLVWHRRDVFRGR